MAGAVYVQTNEPENRVVAFRRGAEGALERIGDVPTGGRGDGVPHLTSQGSVVLTGDALPGGEGCDRGFLVRRHG